MISEPCDTQPQMFAPDSMNMSFSSSSWCHILWGTRHYTRITADSARFIGFYIYIYTISSPKERRVTAQDFSSFLKLLQWFLSFADIDLHIVQYTPVQTDFVDFNHWNMWSWLFLHLYEVYMSSQRGVIFRENVSALKLITVKVKLWRIGERAVKPVISKSVLKWFEQRKNHRST